MFLPQMQRYKNTLIVRLTLLYALIFILSTSATFLVFYYRIYSVTMNRLDDELVAEVKTYADHLARGGFQEIAADIDKENQAGEADEQFYRMLDINGAVLAATDLSQWPSIPVISHAELQKKPNGRIVETFKSPHHAFKTRMITAIIGPASILQIGETLEEADEYLGIFRQLFLILLSILIILSVLIGWYLAHRALSDIKTVTRTARKIAQGMFTQRVLLNGRFDEIQQLGAAFNNMLDRIQTLLKSLKEINDNIAHDLRSPLTRIRGFAEMSLVGKNTGEAYKDMAANIMEECDSLIDMINTMLDITEAEAGVSSIVKEDLDLGAMIRDACELFKPIADEKRITLKVDLPPDFSLQADRKKLQRVLTNLLENAIKYTTSLGIVAISGHRENGIIQVFFQDTGIGIEAEDLPHIFERFYRCDRSRPQGGVGLGLSLAKAYVEAMDGKISVNSTVGKGSVFRLQLAS